MIKKKFKTYKTINLIFLIFTFKFRAILDHSDIYRMKYLSGIIWIRNTS